MPSEYPPASHLLRDLPFVVEVVDSTRHRARVPAATGFDTVPFGSTAIVVDVLAGAMCMGVISPDWMATSVLGLHLSDVPAGDEMLVEASLVRAGQQTVTIGVEIRTAAELVGHGLVTFARLQRRDSNLDVTAAAVGDTFSFADPGPGPGGSLEDAIGCVVLDAAGGVSEMPITEYVQNSFGAVNGGVVATLADVAARALGTTVLGAPAHTTDATVHYLGQGRQGPVRTGANVVRCSSHSATLRVEVTDHGQLDADGVGRLMAVAHLVVSTER